MTTPRSKAQSKFAKSYYINKLGEKWHKFWNQPVTIQYAYSPSEVIGNGGQPHNTTVSAGEAASGVGAAVAAPALIMGATAAPIATGVSLGLGILGDYVGNQLGKRTVKLLGGDEYAQEFGRDIFGFTGGLLAGGYGGKRAQQAVNAYKLSKAFDLTKDITPYLEQKLAGEVTNHTKIFEPKNINTPSTSLALVERPKAKITTAEFEGIPKGTRNQPLKEKIPVSNEFESPDIPTQTLYPEDIIHPVEIKRLNADELIGHKLNTALDFFEQSKLEYLPEFKTPSYIQSARNYYANLGYDLDKYSDDAIARLLTQNYKQLTTNQSGILKNKVFWHGSSSNNFDILDAGVSGTFTGNKGLYGTGFYLTNYPNTYGQRRTWNPYTNRERFYSNTQPFVINNIHEIGGNPRLGNQNTYGLVWHQPDGNLTIPIEKSYQLHYFDNGNSYGIPEGTHWHGYNSDGTIRLAPPNFKGYHIQKTGFDQFGNLGIIEEGTGYKQATGNDSWLSLKPGRAFQSQQTITARPGISQQIVPEFIQDGIVYPATEIVVPYSTQVKSLFPHPELFKIKNGVVSINRNWSDKRINYQRGGKLNYLDLWKKSPQHLY